MHDLSESEVFKEYVPNFWASSLEEEVKRLSIENDSEESCFLLKDGKLTQVKNVHDEPENYFALSYFDGEKAKKADAFIHSHINGYRCPSSSDLKCQKLLNIPCGIVPVENKSAGRVLWLGDGILDVPLVGRDFIHGVYDCYSLVRSYFWQKLKVKLRDYDRDDEWWFNNQDLYEQNFMNEGFEVIDLDENLQVGDCFLMKITGPVSHHAAVYLGDEKILHHLDRRLSRVDNLSQWGRFITKTVRYTK